MRRAGIAVLLVTAGFALSCSDGGPLEPEPAPELGLVIRGGVEARGAAQEGAPVQVRGLRGIGLNPGDCEESPWLKVAQGEARSDASGHFSLTLVADSTHRLVVGHNELEVCVHVMGRDPNGGSSFMLYEVSSQWMRDMPGLDTLTVHIDFTSLLPAGGGQAP